jgi:hypothetical protein
MNSNLVSCSIQAPECSRVYEMFGGFSLLGVLDQNLT